MSPEDIQKLLGGYATGTLTPAEQQALFEAALQDQDLFDALAREQPLRDLLNDPAARAHLLAAIDDAPAPWYRRWLKPVPAAAVAVVLTVAAIIVVVRQQSHRVVQVMVAKVELTAALPAVEPAAATPPGNDILPS